MLLAVALAAAGCGGGGDSSTEISTGALSGKVGGLQWTVGTAQSNAFLSSGDRYFVDMYPSTFTACDTFGAPSNVNEVIVDLPKSVGSYNLSLSLNATFYNATSSDNLVATRGRIVIDSVTATTIHGGAHMTYDAANTVDGQFTVSICP